MKHNSDFILKNRGGNDKMSFKKSRIDHESEGDNKEKDKNMTGS